MEENTVTTMDEQMEGKKRKRKFHASFLLMIPYLLLDAAVISIGLSFIEELLGDFLVVPTIVVYVQGFVALAIILLLHLSPMGEALARKRTKCYEIIDPALKAQVDDMYREAFAKAKALNPNLKDDINLYINDEKSPNALAVGTKTICLTKGLLKRSRSEIVAVLTHELAHISYKDTTINAIISGGNTCAKVTFFFWKLVIMVIFGIFLFLIYTCMPSKSDKIPKKTLYTRVTHSGGRVYAESRIGYDTLDVTDALGARAVGGVMGVAAKLLTTVRDLLVNAPVFVWRILVVLLTTPVSRAMEYDADAFAHDAGCGDGMCSFLQYIRVTYFSKGRSFIDQITSSHPDPKNRIDRLQQMGA